MISQEIHENWSFRKKGDVLWLPAQVPGCIHTDLFENKLIPDPLFGANEKEVQWIENEEWEYHCSFNVSTYILTHDQLEIWFYGVDTYAEISLNGQAILLTNNMFHPWCANVKKLIHEGENTIDVCFASPFLKGLEKYKKLPYQLPANNDKGEFKVSPFSRKAAYQYGWDWCPRLLTSGFWKNIELLAFNKLKIRDFYILQKEQILSYASLVCELELEVHSAGEYVFALYVDKDLLSTGKLRLTEGINRFNLPFGIQDPKLWYPRGYGKPDIYKITIDIKDEDNIIDTRQTTTGIRKIELVREHAEGNESFYFKVNGVNVFARGSNIIPIDYFLPRIKKKDYKALINNAVSVNMNMLRVWGGAAYENDSFYNLCNQEGIMVWQDFMFACMMYPSDNEFLASVQEEIEYNVKRLRNHPSVILWCGNNEVLEGFHFWGWKEKLGVHAGEAFESYDRIFYDLIPESIVHLDKSRPYIPSSPSSSYKGLPNLESGDYHYWDIIKQPLPLKAYEENVGRFMSEFGFKSYPELKTIHRYAEEKDLSIRSEVLELHQGWESGADLVERHVNELFGKPDSFENFLYFSQLTQATAIKIAVEAHRRAKPHCMGTLFWQLNDCWPCASWSAIDYFGKWKALMYELKHLFADCIVSPIVKNNILQVYAISDKPFPVEINVSLKILNFDGRETFKKEIDFQLKKSAAALIFSIPLDKLKIDNLKNQVVLVTEMYCENKLLDRNLMYFVRPADLMLNPAEPSIEISVTDNNALISLKSQVLIKSIYLEYPGVEGSFSDNYFDLLPGEMKQVSFVAELPIPSENRFAIKSLNNLIII
jgi:beta-mannosidase